MRGKSFNSKAPVIIRRHIDARRIAIILRDYVFVCNNETLVNNGTIEPTPMPCGWLCIYTHTAVASMELSIYTALSYQEFGEINIYGKIISAQMSQY